MKYKLKIPDMIHKREAHEVNRLYEENAADGQFKIIERLNSITRIVSCVSCEIYNVPKEWLVEVGGFDEWIEAEYPTECKLATSVKRFNQADMKKAWNAGREK